MLMAARVNWIVQTKLKPMICPSVLPSEACTELSNTDVAAGLSRSSSISPARRDEGCELFPSPDRRACPRCLTTAFRNCIIHFVMHMA